MQACTETTVSSHTHLGNREVLNVCFSGHLKQNHLECFLQTTHSWSHARSKELVLEVVALELEFGTNFQGGSWVI